MSNEGVLRDWTKHRPAITRTYDDLIRDVQAGNIKQNVVPIKQWGDVVSKSFKDRDSDEVGAFYSNNEINYPLGNESSIPHELLHYFSSHTPGRYGVPKMDPYTKADVKYKGWLPSLHKAGRRPTLPGNNRLSNWWNENMATQQTEYSNKWGYHPWYDEHAYDTTADLMKENLLSYVSDIEKPVRHDKNMYPIYQKQSQKAQSFRDAFRSARKGGEDIFEWDNRSYTTELA